MNIYPPGTNLNIIFQTNTQTKQIQNNNVLKPKNASKQPQVSIKNIDEKSYYTILMIDLDAPSKNDPKFSPWLHWFIINIPGKDLKTDNLNNGELIMPYTGPTPPPGTGQHQYKIILYEQTEFINNKIKLSQTDRPKFVIKNTINPNLLTLIAEKIFLSNSV